MSNFESLANELLLCLFEYFDDVHLFRAFYGLNIRLNDLLTDHSRLVHFDFRSIYRKDFNSICQHYLPSIIDRTVSLHLSDNDDTPEQVHLFLILLMPSLDQFIQLQSLSLSNLQDSYLIHQILLPLHNLTRLNLSACYVTYDLVNGALLIDTIWKLPKLLSCQLQNLIPYGIFHSAPTIESLSLQYLTIDDLDLNFTELVRLFQYTPSLQYLEISIWDIHHSSESIPLQFSSLSRLNLSFKGSLQILINILQITSNIECLILRTRGLLIDGHQWEQIIEDYLPKLQRLRFLMQHSSRFEENDEGPIGNFFRTFQTEFWLKKHQWFTQYHWNESRSLFFYTLPYSLDDFVCQNNHRSQSTSPNELQHRMFDRVHHLSYEIAFHKKISIDSSLHFSNIQYLHLDLPFNEHFWSIIPCLHSLLALTIERFNNGQALSQFQSLLDRSPNLHSLTFTSSSISLKLFFQLNCSIIRQLNFFDCNHYFNKQQCRTLINSSFSQQCEILWIKLKKRSEILQLVTKIPSLRTLIFQCEDHSEGHQLIDWLSNHIPSTCFISEDRRRSKTIRIWIR